MDATAAQVKFLIEESIARGIFILVDKNEANTPPETARLLRNALAAAGLRPTIVPVQGLGNGNVDLAIGIQ